MLTAQKAARQSEVELNIEFSGHALAHLRCPLLRVKRTSLFVPHSAIAPGSKPGVDLVVEFVEAWDRTGAFAR